MISNEILVTGSSGFIGNALVQTLYKRNASVRCCSRKEGIYSDVIIQDIGPDTDWTKAISGISHIVHLAGRAHVLSNTAKKLLGEYRRINVEGTLNLAYQAAALDIKRFIYISSVGVNGVQNYRPFVEEDPPHPTTPYAISKLEAEQGLRKIATETTMDVVIIRPPLVYGPGVPGNFKRLLNAVAKGTILPLGAVHNKRSLVALDNLVDFVITCIDNPAASNQTFLVSDSEDLSTTDLIRRVAAALDRRVHLLPIPVALLKAGAVLLGKKDLAQQLLGSLQVDITKARTLLGWAPLIGVDEGLERTARWYRQYIH